MPPGTGLGIQKQVDIWVENEELETGMGKGEARSDLSKVEEKSEGGN